MKLSQYVRDYGLDSLKELSDLSGVSVRTLHNWYAERRKLFDLLLFAAWINKQGIVRV